MPRQSSQAAGHVVGPLQLSWPPCMFSQTLGIGAAKESVPILGCKSLQQIGSPSASVGHRWPVSPLSSCMYRNSKCLQTVLIRTACLFQENSQGSLPASLPHAPCRQEAMGRNGQVALAPRLPVSPAVPAQEHSMPWLPQTHSRLRFGHH